MSRFGDLLRGKKAAPAPAPAPEPVVEEVVGSPILGEDTTNYHEVIEEEVYESDVSLHGHVKERT